jgi:hypothetical protein
VSFYDSITGTAVLLGTGTLSGVSGSDVAELQTSFTVGSHPITAVYGGDATHAGSTGSLTEIIDTLTLTTATLPSATVGVVYSQTLSASGGGSSATYTYAVTSGSLPAGLLLSASGVISGTPTAAGPFSFTVTATESGNSSLTGSQVYALTVAAPTITLTPTTLPAGEVGVLYASQTITASGGISPYTYSISSGALPAGLTLSTTGALSGTPTASGTFTFTVRATDSSTGAGSPCTGSQLYTLTVAAPAITLTPATLPAGELGVLYSSQTITASGGVSPYTYKVSSGALPNGLTLSSAGGLSGTPALANTYSFTVVATDSSSGPYSSRNTYSILIARQPSLTTVSASSASATHRGLPDLLCRWN